MSNLSKIIEQIDSEFRVNADGVAFVSIRGAARIAGVSPSGLFYSLQQGVQQKPKRLVQFLVQHGFQSDQVNAWTKSGVPRTGLICILDYYAFHAGRYCKEKAFESLCLLEGKPYTPRKNNFQGLEDKIFGKSNSIEYKNCEKSYQIRLAKSLGGQTEVATIAGNIDVLTSDQLIEVKSIKQWKFALGQVLAYGVFYPSHQKRLHLFGETQLIYLDMIVGIVKKYGVTVTWEQ